MTGSRAAPASRARSSCSELSSACSSALRSVVCCASLYCCRAASAPRYWPPASSRDVLRKSSRCAAVSRSRATPFHRRTSSAWLRMSGASDGSAPSNQAPTTVVPCCWTSKPMPPRTTLAAATRGMIANAHGARVLGGQHGEAEAVRRVPHRLRVTAGVDDPPAGVAHLVARRALEHQLEGVVGSGRHHPDVVEQRGAPDALVRQLELQAERVRHRERQALGLEEQRLGEHGVGLDVQLVHLRLVEPRGAVLLGPDLERRVGPVARQGAPGGRVRREDDERADQPDDPPVQHQDLDDVPQVNLMLDAEAVGPAAGRRIQKGLRWSDRNRSYRPPREGCGRATPNGWPNGDTCSGEE